MKNSDYWRRRFTILESAQERGSLEYLESLDAAYRKATKAFQKDIDHWYARFAENNQIDLAEAKKLLNSNELAEFKWTVQEYVKYGKKNGVDGQWTKQLENASSKFHISRLEALQMQIQQQVEVLYGNQQDGLDKHLRSQYSDRYYHSAFEIHKGLGVGWRIDQFDDKQLDNLLRKPWTTDAKTFSDRVWSNKQQLLNELQTGLVQNIIRGDSPDALIDHISKRMGVAKHRASALVMTESAYFASQAQEQCYKDLDVEEYEVVATLDNKTSNICQELDGKVFKISDYKPGVTAPPFHVYCRSVTAPYFEDNAGKRSARNGVGKTYYIPDDIKYKEWENTFVIDKKLSKKVYDVRDKLRGLDAHVYKNIWKDDVTPSQYSDKKASVEAKRSYFNSKLQTAAGEEQTKFEGLLKDLEDFEKKGKQYEALEIQYKQLQAELRKKRNDAIITLDAYSQERKDAAYWFTNRKEADAVLRPPTGDTWKSLTDDEKRAAFAYTSGSGKFNRPLRGYDDSWYNYKGPGQVSLDNEGAGKMIKNLTTAIDKSKYDFDIWLQRGVETPRGVASFLGINESQLSGTLEELQNLLMNKIVKDEAFISTSAYKGGGFSGTVLNIYAPKGTKMLFAEPFSKYGYGPGVSWDGESEVTSFGPEFEVILQRGYGYKVKKIEQDKYGKLYIDLDVILE